MRLSLILGLMLATPLLWGSQLSLSPADVIGYTGGSWPNGWFPASSILDTQTGPVTENPATASVTDPALFSYWLNAPDGPTNAYILIDLGAAHHITQFELFNTHNRTGLDRGTGKFSIEASNFITAGAAGSVGFDLAGTITTLVDSDLDPVGSDPVTGQFFTTSDAGYYRYIRFSPHSVAAAGTAFSSNAYGLDELRVFEHAPEPASFVLLCGGLAAFAFVRRRRAAR